MGIVAAAQSWGSLWKQEGLHGRSSLRQKAFLTVDGYRSRDLKYKGTALLWDPEPPSPNTSNY